MLLLILDIEDILFGKGVILLDLQFWFAGSKSLDKLLCYYLRARLAISYSSEAVFGYLVIDEVVDNRLGSSLRQSLVIGIIASVVSVS